MDFKDYFSTQAKEYSKHRPKYPPELFEYLASLVTEHNTAWDSATGSGQAALGLAPYFEKVIATDASKSQIEHSHPHDKIEYRVAPSESSRINDSSVNLATVATAIHWINTDKFYLEVKRVSKPGGIIAIWTYSESEINPEIDPIVKKYSKVIIGEHWPPENKKAWNFEELTDFPFERLSNPDFKIVLDWDLKDYLNYLYTWSATHNYIRNTGVNPLEHLYEELIKVWKDESTKRKITWHLNMKVGKV